MKIIPKLLFTLFVTASTTLLTACSTLKEPSKESLNQTGYDAITQYMSAFIRKEIKKEKITGLSIALVDDQKIVWSQGFGFADKKNKIPASDQTRYRAGSISKTFTAMAIMQLHEQGKLNINSPLTHYVPELQIKTRNSSIEDITLRNIMAHHSGLPGGLIDGMWATTTPDSFKTVATRISRYYVAYPPDAVFAYSNAAFSLAGHTIENVTNTQYKHYMHEYLLKPLQMNNSDFSNVLEGKRFSKAYMNGKEIIKPLIRDIPAGGLNTTVLDLSQLIKMVNANGRYRDTQVLQQPTLQLMHTPQYHNIALDLNQRVGLGWFFNEDFFNQQHTVVGHTGHTIAHNSLLAIAKEAKLGVVIMANEPNNNDALKRIAKTVMQLSMQLKSGDTDTHHITTTAHKQAPAFSDMTGFYASSFGFITITGKPKAYTIKIEDTKLALANNNDGSYSLKYKILGFIPIDIGEFGNIKITPQIIDNHQLLIGENQGQQFIIAKKVLPDKRRAAWDKRIGKYSIINQLALEMMQIDSISLYYNGEFYMIATQYKNGALSHYPLLIVNDQEAIVDGIGRDLGETLLVNTQGTATVLEYSGMRFKQL